VNLVRRYYPGTKALAKRLYLRDMGDKGFIIETVSKRKKNQSGSESERFLVDGVEVGHSQQLALISGDFDKFTKSLMMASWAVEHTSLVNQLIRPGYILGYKQGFMDVILATLRLPKWRLLCFEISPMVRDITPDQFFSDVKPNPFVRQICKLAAVDSRVNIDYYSKWVDSSYISTSPTFAGMVNLVDKLSQPAVVWATDPRVIKVCIAELMKKIFKDYTPQRFRWDSATIHAINYHASSGIGFPFCPNLPQGSKKKDVILKAMQIVARLCERLADGAQIFALINAGLFKALFKPETKTYKDEKGKIRHITQLDMVAELIMDLLDRFVMTHLQTLPWYSPGMSIYSSFIPNVLLALGHKIYNRYLPQFQNPKFEEAFPGEKIHYICLDQSTQDGRFIKATLELTYRLRTYGHDFTKMTQQDLNVFMQLQLHADVTTFHKMIQWFNGSYYNQLQSNSSGDKFTTVANCVEQEFVLRVAITTIIIEKMPEVKQPWVIAQSIPIIICGDNSVLKIPDKYLHLFCSTEEDYPDVLDLHLSKIGIKLKRDETFLCRWSWAHQDKFFSTIQNDKVIQKGVIYLQRRFVKIGPNNELLPADHPNPFKFGSWRHHRSAFVKVNNHDFNWEHPSKQVSVALFQKAFSLLFDVGYNRIAHNFLRAVLRRLVVTYPCIFEWSTAFCDFAELKIKVDVQPHWMKRVLEEDSFDFVTSQMCPSIASAQLRNPVFRNPHFQK